MEKRITINELAKMVSDGFIRVDERFDQIDKRFDRLEDRVGNVEGKVGSLEVKIGSLEIEIHGTSQRIDRLVSVIDDHSKRIKKLEMKAA
ncbi:MAG: hypothetical protein JWL88_746 [Parcubacteria group bacterium]|nr:hypothetical protein [Parcubacteria group bacterium]